MGPGFLGCNPIGVEVYRVNFDYELSRHPVGLSAHGLDPWGRPGPIVPQAPEFERFLWPCSLGKRHTGWEMSPGLRRDGVIYGEGAMNANRITASFRGGDCSIRSEDPLARRFRIGPQVL